jgi:hypothetical protein
MRRSPRWRSALSVLVLVAFAACSRSTQPGQRGRSPQLITAAEIEQSQAVNAYEAVLKLRANFLSNRGPTSIVDRNAPQYPNVYVDGMQFGPLASLRSIPANQIASIRLYRAWEATTKFGTGNAAGVIEIISRTQ